MVGWHYQHNGQEFEQTLGDSERWEAWSAAIHGVTKSQTVNQSVSSVAKSCPTLCDSMDCSMPGFSVHHQLPELAQTHPLSQWCHPTILSSIVHFSSCLQSFRASRFFQMSQFFASGGQSTGASALALSLPKKSQGWSPSEWTGWISLQFKGLSRVFSNTTVQSINFSALNLLHSPTLTSIHDHWENHSLD